MGWMVFNMFLYLVLKSSALCLSDDRNAHRVKIMTHGAASRAGISLRWR